MGKIAMQTNVIKILSVLFAGIILLMPYSCSSKSSNKPNGAEDKKVITIAVTQKPTYPDMITYAIQPVMEKKGYVIKQKPINEARMLVNLLNDGEIDMVIAGHRAAYDYLKKHTGVDVATLITVPSATEGIFSQTLDAHTIDELKRQVKKNDVVLVPDDPSNLPRSLIFLEKLGFLKFKENVVRSEATERDIAENSYGLVFRAMNAAQIPRNLESVAFAVVFGDDADLLGILDQAITREASPGEEYLILFGVKPGNEDRQWAKDFKEAVLSEEYRNVIEDPQYRFHKYQRPKWYVEKWGIENKY
jgi:D-methionine transport system substrate-binding protein